uniref:KDO-transferase n=1 Tax=Chlamydia pneumoniae TaxID=83558 RepID=A0A0F7WXZ4_CHLPN|nr:KDO-transferase [Chlamydia pneumoniae]
MLLEDLDTDSIPWPKLYLSEDFDFAYYPESKAIIDTVAKLEKNNPGEEFCLESKKILARYLLEQLFKLETGLNFPTSTIDGGRESFLIKFSHETKKPSIWAFIYFYYYHSNGPKLEKDFKQAGCEVHNRLLNLGLKYRPQAGAQNDGRNGGPYGPIGFLIVWEENYGSVLKDHGFIKDN